MKLRNNFEKFDGFFFDCDGVLWYGSKLLPKTKDVINQLERLGKEVAFISNNSTLSISKYQELFLNFGLKIEQKRIITSTQATIEYLIGLRPKIKKTYVIGEQGLLESLISAGFEVIDSSHHLINYSDIQAVVVGMDRQFTYSKLETALRMILAGARFIGTNPDPQYTTPQGFSPGAGSMIGALARAADMEPEIICGKPDPLLANILLKRLNLKANQCIMIGDRVSTDMQFALNAKLCPVLVKTGFGGSELGQNKNFPFYAILEGLIDLFEES